MTQIQTPRHDVPGRMGQLEFVLFDDETNTTAAHPSQEFSPAYPILSKHWPGFPFTKSEARDMNKARDWYSNKTQVFWTCEALLAGRAISHQTEIREVRGWRLGAMVHRLRHDYDWLIEAEYRGHEYIAFYRLNHDADRKKLRFLPSASMLNDEEAA